MIDPETAQLLDELAANAVPPLVCQHVGPFRLRWGPDGRRRTCSVFVPAGAAQPSATELVEAAEDFYSRHGGTARFQLSRSGTEPHPLDGELAARRYHDDAPVTVLVADLRTVSAALAGRASTAPAEGVDLGENQPPPIWCELYALLAGSDQAQARTGTFQRVGPPAAFATAPAGSLGVAVVERGWVGFFSIETLEAARGQGLATSVMSVLATWAAGRGARRCYLQVATGNEVAAAWYERLGFEAAYEYWYRARELPGPMQSARRTDS